MAIEHARICGACEHECPGWATRCPVCGSLGLVHRIVIVPPAPSVAAITKSKHSRRSRAHRLPGREPPPHTTPARSTA